MSRPKRKHLFNVRMFEEEREQLEAVSTALDKNKSETVRHLVEEKLSEIEESKKRRG
jgi:predicted DNA-binding protein